MKHTLYFDGACGPGGIATYGWLIKANQGEVIAQGHGEHCRGNGATNNTAEYSALVNGLRAAKALGISSLRVKGDSRLVVNQMRGRWRVKAPILKPLHEKAKDIEKTMTLHFAWIPRSQNKEADNLSKKALREVNEFLTKQE